MHDEQRPTVKKPLEIIYLPPNKLQENTSSEISNNLSWDGSFEKVSKKPNQILGRFLIEPSKNRQFNENLTENNFVQITGDKKSNRLDKKQEGTFIEFQNYKAIRIKHANSA